MNSTKLNIENIKMLSAANSKNHITQNRRCYLYITTYVKITTYFKSLQAAP